LLNFFEDKIELFKSHNRAILEQVKESLFNLREIKVNSYFTERIKANIRFIESYLRKYSGGESLLLSDSSESVVQKFDEIIKIVDEEIKNKYYSGLEERLHHYNSKIDDIKLELSHSQKDLDSYKRRMNEKLKMNLNDYDSQMSSKINVIESKVNNIDEKSDLDPSTTFKNAFTYTSMLSIMVLLLSGFASYSNSDFNEMASFSNVIRTVLVEGAQWALITFLVGTVVSIFTTIATVVQKSSYKQNMVKKVSAYIDEKEKGKEHLRKETEYMIKQMDLKTVRRGELFEEEIKDLESKRKKEDARLRAEADSKIKFELEKLQSFYN
jgi:predicted ester cyclase